MFDRAKFDAFVDSLELKNFSADEILTKTDRPLNHPPEEEIWGHIAPTIIVLDRLRAELAVPIYLNSVYRRYEYNERIPKSAKRSQHIAFTAIDFRSTSSRRHMLDDFTDLLISWRGDWFPAPREFPRVSVMVEGRPVFSEALRWRTVTGKPEFQFRGGVSLYSSFVHIDTRGADVGW